MQSRYYNPQVNKFINADKIIAGVGSNVTGYNVFSYSKNNPVNMSDETGHWPQWLEFAGNWVNSNIIQPIVTDFKNFNIDNTSEDVTINSNYFSGYKGQIVIRADLGFCGHRSGSFGIMALDYNVGKASAGASEEKKKAVVEEGRRTVKHERGHFTQLRILGPKKYVEKIAIPSVFSEASYKDYYNQPWERSADIFGGVYNRPDAPYYDGSYQEAYNYIFRGNS